MVFNFVLGLLEMAFKHLLSLIEPTLGQMLVVFDVGVGVFLL